MMKKIVLLLTFFSFQYSIYSQIHRCGDVLHKEYLKNNFKEIYDNIIEPKDVSTQRNNTVHRIPVVVHIVHNGNDENLTDAIVNNQIDILNKDFRRQNEDASNTREVFKAVAGDAMIEFYLAQQDPNGNATTGITRTKTQKVSFLDLDIFLFLQAAIECDVDFTDPASIEAAQECLDKFFEEKGLNFDNIFSSLDNIKSTSKGGIDPWNPKKYLNIWVGDLSIDLLGQKIPFLLGFAYPPVGAPLFPEGSLPEGYEKNDGVVIHYQVFGSKNPALGTLTTNNKGRTCTHEVGHYLGLRHIWGDGDCTMDDGISDTPDADAASQSEELNTCMALHAKNTCTEASGNQLPDMIENYMDYSIESCMNMFTNGQINMMRSMLEGPRAELIGLPANNIELVNSLYIFPNPVANEIFFSSGIDKASLQIINTYGQVVMVKEIENEEKLNVDELVSGYYFLKLKKGKETAIGKFVKL